MQDEQSWLKGWEMAIDGLGGVGGAPRLTLARLRIAKLCILDFDGLAVHNVYCAAFDPLKWNPTEPVHP
jgi:tRNA A37 threonylcarbamoyladenosine dehydratase